MGFAAVFGALAPEVTRLVGLQPEVVAAVWHHVDLTGEFRHPEGVNHVGGAQIDTDGAAGGDDEFIAGHEITGAVDRLARILEGKPPLVTDGVDFIGIGLLGLRNVVDIPNGAEGGHRDDNEGQHGGADQTDLDEGVAVALWRHGGVFAAGLGLELDGGVGEDAGHDHEDHADDPEGYPKEVHLRARNRALRVECVLRTADPATPKQGGKCQSQRGKQASKAGAKAIRETHVIKK